MYKPCFEHGFSCCCAGVRKNTEEESSASVCLCLTAFIPCPFCCCLPLPRRFFIFLPPSLLRPRPTVRICNICVLLSAKTAHGRSPSGSCIPALRAVIPPASICFVCSRSIRWDSSLNCLLFAADILSLVTVHSLTLRGKPFAFERTLDIVQRRAVNHLYCEYAKLPSAVEALSRSPRGL